jgi:preprotein translocase subunit SecY
MWEKIRVIFTIPELRQKILLTLALLAVYRIGYQIPLPLIDTSKTSFFGAQKGGLTDFMNQVAMFSASRLDQATIFGLGIMPYISASIIFQLLGSVYPPLEKLQKEGETGRKKINEYTRYATVVLCLFQSWMYLHLITRNINSDFLTPSGALPRHWAFLLVLTMTTGTTFLMWLGEQIDEYGIGNGISLLIMAGIIARMPDAGFKIIGQVAKSGLHLGGAGKGTFGVETLLVLAILFVAVVAGVVFITQGQRRIPTHTAKHIRGRRQFGGTRQYLPLRVNQAGVMPIIFASSLLLFPSVFFTWLAQSFDSPVMQYIQKMFDRYESFSYNVFYIGLIYFFCYFWTAITFNPKDMADNLKKYGTFIPGYRPGRRTADYLEKVMVRITYVGAGFLAVVAIVPTVIMTFFDVDYNMASFYGGTSLLIAVSVAFDLVQKIDSHLVMRNYKGLIERT